MAVSYPLSLPSGLISVSLTPQKAVAITRNPFSFQSYKQDWGGDRWIAQVAVQVRTEPQIAEWRAFLSALANGKGNFLLGDPNYMGAKGWVDPSATVNGSGQAGTTVDLTGFQANAVVLKAGDCFQIENRLYTALQDATSDGLGEVTVDIFPSLRGVPADGATVTFAKPKGLFRVIGAGQLVGLPQRLYRVSFQAEEDV